MKLNVLFVEDSVDDAELMLRRLREAGIEPQWDRVENAEALRAVLRHGAWQVALVDFNMPGFGGLRALRQLAEEAPDLPAITVSGAISEDTAVKTMTAGAVDYVLKDNLTRLAPAVTHAVEGAELRRRQRQAAEQARQSLFAVHHASLAILYIDMEGTILYANEAAARLGGVASADAVGQQVWGWTPAVSPGRWAELWRAAAHEPVVDFETTVVRVDGEHRSVTATLDRLDRDEDPFMIVYARDVTEQREIEQLAQESEARYGRLTDNLPDIIFRYELDPPGITYINPAVESVTGHAQREFYADPALLTAIVHRDDAGLMEHLLASSVPTADPVVMRWIGKDGDARWIESRVVPVRAADGGLVAVEGIARDVTALRRASEQLAHSRDLLDYVVSHARSAIAIHDRDLNYIYVSERYLRDYGIEEQNVIGRHHYEVFPDLPPKWREVHQKALAGEICSADQDPWIREDGSVDWTRWECRPWYDSDGSIGGIIVYTEVITASVEAEQALRESEDRFRRVSETTADFVYSCARAQGEGFRFDWLSGAVERITGYTHDELLEMGCWKPLVVEEDVALFEAKVTGLAAGESSACELRIRHKDGEVRWLAAYNQMAEDAAGAPLHHLYGACQDITARKSAEEKVRRHAQQLRRTVEGAVHAMGHVVETRDPYTAGHERRVSELAVAIARDMGMGGAELDGLRLAGLIHDIGKIAVPAEILAKPGKLTPVEFNLVKQHARAGYDILADIDFERPVAEMALQHHERLDGSGYPQGLHGGNILPEARILAVADVVEAMSSHRPYRATLGMEAALAEIREHAGEKYDPDVAAACERVVGGGFEFTP